MALQAGSRDPTIKAFVTISATDLGTSLLQSVPAGSRGLPPRALLLDWLLKAWLHLLGPLQKIYPMKF